MSKKIYVGNMNYNTSERQLQDLFAQYGDVSSVNIIVDRFTGKAKGFGFVRWKSKMQPALQSPRSMVRNSWVGSSA